MNIILYLDNKIITNNKYNNILYLGYLLNKKINTYIYNINNENKLNNIYNNYITTLDNLDINNNIIINFVNNENILLYKTIYFDIENIIYLNNDEIINYVNINNNKYCYFEEFSNNIYNILYNNYYVIIKPKINVLKTDLLKSTPNLWEYMEKENIQDINEIIYNLNEIKNYKKNINIKDFIKNFVKFNNNKNINLLFNNININIIVYVPCGLDNYRTGGLVVLYYLANLLSKNNYNVYIYCENYNISNHKTNIIFNNIINNLDNIDLNKTIVIYSECIEYNPLNALYVIRWILAPLGYIYRKDIYLTWNKKDLIYYFNYENHFNNDEIYQTLTLLYRYPTIKKLNLEREKNVCYTLRKVNKILTYNNINILNIYHTNTDTEITMDHLPDEYIYIFNTHKYFICYDTLTFLFCISLLCGCITIIYDIKDIDKKTWLKSTFFGPYIEKYNIENIYGLAYGISDKEIKYAEDTIHLAPEYINKIINEINNENLTKFLNNLDINKFKNLNNTIENIFYNK